MEALFYLVLSLMVGAILIIIANVLHPDKEEDYIVTPLNSTIDQWKSYTSSNRYAPVTTEYNWVIHDKLEDKYAPFDNAETRDLAIKQICDGSLNPNWLAWNTAEQFFETLEQKSHERI